MSSPREPKILRDSVVDVGAEPANDSEAARPIDELSSPADAGGLEPAGAASEAAGASREGLWPVDRLVPLLEAVVFAAADPLPIRRLRDVIAGVSVEEIKAAAAQLQADYAGRGIRLVEVAGGYQIRTAPEHHDTVRRLFKERPFRLTRAAIETLAVVAYRQPATRAEVESVRGVDVSGVLETLVERRLIRIAGRRDVPGRPLVYTTTQEFLETFGLKDLKSLPTLPELGDDIRALAEQSGFAEGEDRDAAILPLEEEENRGDEQQAAASVEETGGVDDKRGAAANDEIDSAGQARPAEEEGGDLSPAERP